MTRNRHGNYTRVHHLEPIDSLQLQTLLHDLAHYRSTRDMSMRYARKPDALVDILVLGLHGPLRQSRWRYLVRNEPLSGRHNKQRFHDASCAMSKCCTVYVRRAPWIDVLGVPRLRQRQGRFAIMRLACRDSYFEVAPRFRSKLASQRRALSTCFRAKIFEYCLISCWRFRGEGALGPGLVSISGMRPHVKPMFLDESAHQPYDFTCHRPFLACSSVGY